MPISADHQRSTNGRGHPSNTPGSKSSGGIFRLPTVDFLRSSIGEEAVSKAAGMVGANGSFWFSAEWLSFAHLPSSNHQQVVFLDFFPRSNTFG